MKLLVYGTLMSGQANHRQMRDARLLAVRRTEPRYTLVDLGAYPALVGSGTTSVTGEVYEVDDDLLHALDRFEGAPALYRRAPVRLLGGESVEAYLLARPRAQDYKIIAGGDWRQHAHRSRR